MNIYKYIRVSSVGQLDGDGPERQRDAINAFCHKFALDSAGEYVEAKTGTADAFDRPVFTEMLMSIERLNATGNPSLKISAIVVERLDRLARDMMVSEILIRACRDRGLKIFACDQGQIIDMADTSDEPTRTLMRQILGAIAQWEKTAMVKKLKSARARVKRETGRCSGKKPYGFRPDEAAIVASIFAMHAAGKSDSTIAWELNKKGLKTRSARPWDYFRVHDVRVDKKTRPLLKVRQHNIENVTPFTLQPLPKENQV